MIVWILGHKYVTNFYQLASSVGQLGENSEAKIKNSYMNMIQFKVIILVVNDAGI